MCHKKNFPESQIRNPLLVLLGQDDWKLMMDHVNFISVHKLTNSAVNKGRQPAKTAGYWPILGRLLSSHFTVNFRKKLKIRK